MNTMPFVPWRVCAWAPIFVWFSFDNCECPPQFCSNCQECMLLLRSGQAPHKDVYAWASLCKNALFHLLWMYLHSLTHRVPVRAHACMHSCAMAIASVWQSCAVISSYAMQDHMAHEWPALICSDSAPTHACKGQVHAVISVLGHAFFSISSAA